MIIFVFNLSLRSISRFGGFHEYFPLKEGTVRVPLPFSRNRPDHHSHNLVKALGEGLGLLCAPFNLSIPFTSLSIPFTSLYLSLSLYYLSLPLYICLLPFILSLFSLSFSLAYLLDVFVLVSFPKVVVRSSKKNHHKSNTKIYIS